jgi:hypothetical protein
MSTSTMIACLLAAGSVNGPQAKADDTSNSHTEPLYYYLWRGDSGWRRDSRWEGRWRLGQFDPDGNFVPDARLPPCSMPTDFPPYYTPPGFLGPIRWRIASAAGANEPTYEHRSGRLIAGVATPQGFVPEIGSKILDLKDYDIKTADRPIYNMIDEEAAELWTARRRKNFPDEPDVRSPLPPPGTAPPKAGTPEGYEFRLYRTYMKAPPWFARVIGDVMELGHLNDAGDFIPDYGLPIFPYVKVETPDVLRDGSGRTIYYTLPKGGTEDVWKKKDTEEVYEFRSGRLIKGTLHKTGNFVPELGSKILDFKDYDPRGRRRIYNLPGVLRPGEQK